MTQAFEHFWSHNLSLKAAHESCGACWCSDCCSRAFVVLAVDLSTIELAKIKAWCDDWCVGRGEVSIPDNLITVSSPNSLIVRQAMIAVLPGPQGPQGPHWSRVRQGVNAPGIESCSSSWFMETTEALKTFQCQWRISRLLGPFTWWVSLV